MSLDQCALYWRGRDRRAWSSPAFRFDLLIGLVFLSDGMLLLLVSGGPEIRPPHSALATIPGPARDSYGPNSSKWEPMLHSYPAWLRTR
jgi:hypothetical protein